MYIIARGKIVADETPRALAARSRYCNAVSLQLQDANDMARTREALQNLPGLHSLEDNGGLSLTAVPHAGSEIAPLVNQAIDKLGVRLRSLSIEAGRLDDVFRKLTA